MNVSPERAVYLRNKKLNKILVLVSQILFLVFFILFWEIAANKGYLDSFITSQPSRILKTILNYEENEFWGLTIYVTQEVKNNYLNCDIIQVKSE